MVKRDEVKLNYDEEVDEEREKKMRYIRENILPIAKKLNDERCLVAGITTVGSQESALPEFFPRISEFFRKIKEIAVNLFQRRKECLRK
jgi:hypothetical protein